MSYPGGADQQDGATPAQAAEGPTEAVVVTPGAETAALVAPTPTENATEQHEAVAPNAEVAAPDAETAASAAPAAADNAAPTVALAAIRPATTPSHYSTFELAAEFRQGEVITALEQVVRILPNGNAEVKQHPFAVVFSQDCDLAADHRRRQGGGKSVMNGVLLFEAHPLEGFMGTLGFGSKERKQVKQYDNARYHVLEAAAAVDDLEGQGFTALAIDFRCYFTLTAEDMIGQLSLTARRRARLISPYVEHLQSRAMHYLGRVALPDRN